MIGAYSEKPKSRIKNNIMSLIEVEILVDTEKLIIDYPKGSSMIPNPNEYIAMTIVAGQSNASDIFGSGTAGLGFTSEQNVDIRFFGRPKVPYGSVMLITSGHHVPSNCLVGGHFSFNNGVATGVTVDHSAGRQAYNFVMQVDNFDFTFEWDPFLAVA